MTVIRQFKTAATGGFASTLGLYLPPIAGLIPANRWLAAGLTSGALASWPAGEGSVPMAPVGSPTVAAGRVTLDSTDDALTATIPIPKTVYLIAKVSASYPESVLSYGAIGIRQIDAAGQFAINYSGGVTYPATGYTGAKHAVFMVVADGVNPIKLYVNGVPFAAGATGVFSGPIQIGRYAGTVYGGLDIAEAGAFTAALTDAQAAASYEDFKRQYPALL